MAKWTRDVVPETVNDVIRRNFSVVIPPGASISTLPGGLGGLKAFLNNIQGLEAPSVAGGDASDLQVSLQISVKAVFGEPDQQA